MRVVSLPAVGSVTPNACSRSAPITYICAWQAAALPPWRWISSSTTLASAIPSPEPPYASGMSAASQPAFVRASTNSLGYRRRRSWSRQYASPKPLQMSRIAERISAYEVSSSVTVRSLRRGAEDRGHERDEAPELADPEADALSARGVGDGDRVLQQAQDEHAHAPGPGARRARGVGLRDRDVPVALVVQPEYRRPDPRPRDGRRQFIERAAHAPRQRVDPRERLRVRTRRQRVVDGRALRLVAREPDRRRGQPPGHVAARHPRGDLAAARLRARDDARDVRPQIEVRAEHRDRARLGERLLAPGGREQEAPTDGEADRARAAGRRGMRRERGERRRD